MPTRLAKFKAASILRPKMTKRVKTLKHKIKHIQNIAYIKMGGNHENNCQKNEILANKLKKGVNE